MAFYDEEEEEGQQGQGPTTLGAESGVVGQGAAVAGANASDGAGPSAPKSEPFAGVSKYINANKPQSEKLASQVAGNIETKAQGVDAALQGAQNSFNQAADSQKIEADDGLFGAVKTNAAQVAADKAKADQFAKMRDASYSGPQKLEDIDGGQAWGGLQSALQKARTAKDMAGTEAGRMGLIKEVSNNPRQSQGALTFDNLLLQSNPNAAGMLQNAGSNLKDIDSRISAAGLGAAEKAKAIAANNASVSSKAKQSVNEGFDNLFGAKAGADGKYGTQDDEALNLADSLSGRAAATKKQQEAAYADMQKKIARGDLSEEDMQLLGVTPETRTYNTNLNEFLTKNANADIRTVAGEDDYARQAALSQLMGGNAPTILNEATDKNLMGTSAKGYDYDKGGLQAKIKGRQTDFNNKVQGLVNEHNKLDYVIPGSTQKWVDWLLGGKPVEGWDERGLNDFARTDFGQSLLKLANEYGQSDKAYNPNAGLGRMTGPIASPLRKK